MTQKAYKWVRAKERLPEAKGDYIVWCDGSMPYCNGEGVHAPFHYWPHNGGFREDVTHWMPMPEPPND
jgi:hypothetical protein